LAILHKQKTKGAAKERVHQSFVQLAGQSLKKSRYDSTRKAFVAIQ